MWTLAAGPQRTLWGALLGTAWLMGALMGGTACALFYRAEMATAERHQAAQALQARKDADKAIEQAHAQADALSQRLSELESNAAHTTLEKTHAIPVVTTGRPCLGPGAVRVLNGAAVPGAGAASAAAGSFDAAGDAVATDSDVAGWIADAQGRFEICRGRLNALIDYEEGLAP